MALGRTAIPPWLSIPGKKCAQTTRTPMRTQSRMQVQAPTPALQSPDQVLMQTYAQPQTQL
eukprot:7708422-Alexandrium_andersonii.AAC.1